MGRIALEEVAFAYGAEANVLDAFTLDVKAGEAHALLGPSGSGKTTVLSLLSGLLRPRAGRVTFDGLDVTHADAASRNIAQVFQFPVLYPAMSARRNLEFPLRNRGLPSDIVRRRVDVIAELLGITALLDRAPRSLSAYDKQRVSLARGLVRTDVAAVLLDEPLTAVEPAAKWRLRRALKEVQRELGLTMIYVTHDQLEALTFADRVTVLDRGRVLQSDTPERLVEAPAHTFVGRFIGSPGMNVVSSAAAAPLGSYPVDPRCEIGFRPANAHITASRAHRCVRVVVKSVQVLGTRGGMPWGLITAELGGESFHTRQSLDGIAPGEAWLSVDPAHVCVFHDGWRSDA